jgi:hypothetical protein
MLPWHVSKIDSENFTSSLHYWGRNKGIPYGLFLNSSQASGYVALDWPPTSRKNLQGVPYPIHDFFLMLKE